jgi:protein SCO1/2
MIKRFLTFAGLFLAVSISLTFASAARAAANAPAPMWGADYFPNVPLVTQDGKTVMLYDDLLKGKKVMIDFIFAKCEDGCPLDTANLVRVQKLLGDRVGKDIFMYSITLDPENDTPQVMKEYAAQYGAGPGWLFLTGTRENIDKVRDKFGDRGAKEQHANAVKIGDVARGQWIRVPLTAEPSYIVTELRNTFEPGWSVGKNLKSIAEAPRAEVSGPGQLLFSSRCAACHSFGKGDELGPDLMGITARRERKWLVNYLAEPNKMRARKDPIALELAKNNKVLMPNLALTKKQLEEIMEYLDVKSVVVANPKVQPPLAAADTAVGEKPAAMAHDHAQHDHSQHNHAAHDHAGETK